MNLETVEFTLTDGVATIALNRPNAANAIDVQLAKDLGVDVRQGFLLRSVRIQARLGTPPGITACMPSAADLRNRLATLCTTAGVPRSGLHALRRGRAKHLRISGASRSTIQVFGAWRTPAMADHYSDAYPADDDYNESE